MLRPDHAPGSIPPPAEETAGAAVPGARRERNATATKARLLDAGEREFAARGFAGARLREIAVAAGVQPALIHHYFADKQGLYRAVLDRAMLPTSTESWNLLESRSNLEGLVEGFIDMLVGFYAAHQHLLSILRHEALSGSQVLADLSRERMLPIIEALTAFIDQQKAAGEVRADVSAADIISAAMSMVIYPFVEEGMFQVILPAMAQRDAPALERRKQSIVKLLLGGIRPPAR